MNPRTRILIALGLIMQDDPWPSPTGTDGGIVGWFLGKLGYFDAVALPANEPYETCEVWEVYDIKRHMAVVFTGNELGALNYLAKMWNS